MKIKLTKHVNEGRIFFNCLYLLVTYIITTFTLTKTEFIDWSNFLITIGGFELTVIFAVWVINKFKSFTNDVTLEGINQIFYLIWKQDNRDKFVEEIKSTLLATLLGYFFSILTGSYFYLILIMLLIVAVNIGKLITTSKQWSNGWVINYIKGYLGSKATKEAIYKELASLIINFGIDNPKYRDVVISSVIYEIVTDLTNQEELSEEEQLLLNKIFDGSIYSVDGMTFEKNIEMLLNVSESFGEERIANITKLLMAYTLLD